MNRKRTFLALLVCGLLLPAAASAQKASKKPAAPAQAAGRRVDINSARQIDLEKLPGIDRPTAKKIIAGRPYLEVSDLARVGVSKATIEKITPLVTCETSMPSNHPNWTGKSTPAKKAPHK